MVGTAVASTAVAVVAEAAAVTVVVLTNISSRDTNKEQAHCNSLGIFLSQCVPLRYFVLFPRSVQTP